MWSGERDHGTSQLTRRMVTHKHASDELSQQTVTDSRFARPNHQSYSDQLLPGMADRAALVVWGARPWQFGGLGARPCFLVVCLPKPPPTISIAAVCNGKPPKFTGCCTKQPKRNTLFAVLPPKPPTTIWIVAVCYGKPPQFTVCCTKQLKRSLLLTALPPKPLTERVSRRKISASGGNSPPAHVWVARPSTANYVLVVWCSKL